jgi:transposase InsO family protein
MTRQNFYKDRRQRRRREFDEDLVVLMMQAERRVQPRLGGRKLLVMLERELATAGVRIGRDRLFELLRKRDMLVPPLSGAPQTTDSRHNLALYRNLAKDFLLTGPNQLWVADLTYLRTVDGWMFLSLIMDRYSRKIVGYHVNDSLEAIGCIEALKYAQRELPAGLHPLHHSDRGCQYCCHAYVAQLAERRMPVSMTEQDHCAENAHAERLNGILKQEYGLGQTLPSKDHARHAVPQVVDIYNHRRPHSSLGNRTPNSVHHAGASE